MIYFILDLDSGNDVSTYTTEAAALADVRDVATRDGRDEVVSWALGCHEGDGGLTAIADGDALIDRAFRVAAGPHPTTSLLSHVRSRVVRVPWCPLVSKKAQGLGYVARCR